MNRRRVARAIALLALASPSGGAGQFQRSTTTGAPQLTRL
jgi:hypothetical protein